MRIGIYDPYLDTLGGGERYILTIAHCLAKKHAVDLFWNDAEILHKISEKFQIDTSGITIEKNIFTVDSWVRKLLRTRSYDYFFFVSDGSIPLLLGKKNYLIIQHPVNWVDGRTISTQIKLKKISGILCYSAYVKSYLDKTFPLKSTILAPAITDASDSETKRENIILSVGRFTQGMNAKKQEVLIEAFKKLSEKVKKQWKLILVGSFLPQDKEFVTKLEKQASGFSIEIKTDISFQELQTLYQKAKIYWHAAGFGEDLRMHPERAEHFGITTVEAMQAGMVPVVINAGGQKEIVTDGENGYLWNEIGEFLEKTELLIKDEKKLTYLSGKAKERAADFSIEKFCLRLTEIIA